MIKLAVGAIGFIIAGIFAIVALATGEWRYLIVTAGLIWLLRKE